jgi:hypothetical protein
VVRIACDGEVKELDVPKFQPATLPIYDPIFRGTEDSAVSDLSRFLGIPVVARRIPVEAFYDLDLSNKEASSLFRNCNLSTRNSTSSTNSRLWLPFGGIPVQWALDVGPVFVARLDHKPLHPLHAAAIATFCSRYIRTAFQDCLDAEKSLSDSPPQRHSSISSPTQILNPAARHERIYEGRRAVLALATSGNFAEFFEQYKAQRVMGRPDLWGLDTEQLDNIQRAERWSMSADEIEPHPEWEDVPSPFDV